MTRRVAPAAVVALALLLALVPVVWLTGQRDMVLPGWRSLRTVEAELGGDGTISSARVHERLESPDGAVRTQRRDVDAADVPIASQVRYLLDGRPVDADDLWGRSGDLEVLVLLRNVTSEPRDVTYRTADGMRTDTVDVPVPLVADVRLDLDGSWREVHADAARVSAARGEGTAVRWSAALFEPFGSEAAELTLRAAVEDVRPPEILVEAEAVATDASLLAADELLRDRAVSDGVAAVLGASLLDALRGAGEGAAELAQAVTEIEEGIARAPLGEALSPPPLPRDALAPGGLAPSDLLGPLPGEPPLGDLDLAPLLAQLDLADALGGLDTADLLAGADLAPLIEDLLMAAVDGLDELSLDPDVLAGLVADAIRRIGEQVDLGTLLDAIDLAALLESLDLPDWLREKLEKVHLGDALRDRLGEVDLDDVISRQALHDLLADTVPEVDPEALARRVLAESGDRPLAALMSEADVASTAAVLLGAEHLEVELAAVLAAALREADVHLPALGEQQVAAITTHLEGTSALLVAAVTAAEEALTAPVRTVAVAQDAGVQAVAADLRAVAESVRATAGAMTTLELSPLDGLEAALVRAESELTAARGALDAAADGTSDGTPGAEALVRLDGALAEARTRAAEVRRAVETHLGAAAADLGEAAALLDGLAVAVDGRPASGTVTVDVPEAELEALTGVLDAARAAVADVEDLRRTVAAMRDGWPAADLTSVLLAELETGAVDLSPFVATVEQRVAERLGTLRLEDLLSEGSLSEVLRSAGLELDLPALLDELDLPTLDEVLDHAGATLADLLDALHADLVDLLEGLDLPSLEDVLGLDLASFLDALGIDPVDLVGDVDWEAVLDDLDLAAAIRDALDDIDTGELARMLTEAGVDLSDVLDGAAVGEALAGVALPAIEAALADADLDMADLLAAAGVTPADLVAGLRLPDLESLLGRLGLGMGDLLGGMGLDDLGGLLPMLDGLGDGLGALAAGAGELSEGLDLLADEGLAQLVSRLDEENRRALRDLAVIQALDDRAAEEVGARYVLVSRPAQDWVGPAAALAMLLAAVAGVEVLRRRRA